MITQKTPTMVPRIQPQNQNKHNTKQQTEQDLRDHPINSKNHNIWKYPAQQTIGRMERIDHGNKNHTIPKGLLKRSFFDRSTPKSLGG